MAEPLKNQYGPEIPKRIARMIVAVHPTFPTTVFIKNALRGYEVLELMDRGRHIASVLAKHLPAHFPTAANILLQSLDANIEEREGGSMASFLLLPHAIFVAQHGLDFFEESMAAQYVITQRFTAEFSIRPFLEPHPQATLDQLTIWARDPNEHVRRLVSEGTRPRLPWASRLRAFQKNPQPVLLLLEMLKDDPSLYVRRSVANNLNDIGKDHPAILVEVAKRWMKNATEAREWIVRHALRSAVKRGDRGALAVLGFGAKTELTILHTKISPQRAVMGGHVVLSFELTNQAKRSADAMIDFAVHFVKANGTTNAKVFKLKTIQLAAGTSLRLSKKLSLAAMTTRKLYPGKHRIEVLINGVATPLGAFTLVSR